MSTSGTLESSVNGAHLWLFTGLKWSVQSQSPANNTSTVKFQVYLRTSSGTVSTKIKRSVKLTVEGIDYKSSVDLTMGKNTTKVLLEKTLTLSHKVDGTLESFHISANVDIDIVLSNGTIVGDGYTGGYIDLPKIDRPSTFTRSGTPEMGSAQTIAISRKDSNFTHTLKYTWGGSTATIATGIGTSYNWTPPLSMAAKIPNALGGTCKLTLETYFGDELVGSDAITFTLSVPDTLVPTVSSFTLTETEAGLAEHFGAFVNTKSRISYKVTAAGVQGSTIKSYTVKIAGQTFTTTSGTTERIMDVSGRQEATVTVTDSRGKKATKTVVYNALGYHPPRFSHCSAHRINNDYVLDEQGDGLMLRMAGAFAAMDGKSASEMTIEYKLATAPDEEYEFLEYFFSIEEFENEYIYPSYFSPNNTYHVRIKLTDYFTTVTKVLVLSSSRPVFDVMYNGAGFAFNKMAEEPGVLDIGYETRFFGGIRPMVILEGGDLNGVMLPGFYVSVNQEAKNYINCPILGGTFSLEVLGAGAEGQLMQRLTYTSKTDLRVYIRHYYQSEWGEWFKTY